MLSDIVSYDYLRLTMGLKHSKHIRRDQTINHEAVTAQISLHVHQVTYLA